VTSLTSPAAGRDEPLDVALRPSAFADFIGQAEARANLQVFIEAAKRRKMALDHVLFVGPPASARRRWRRSWRANSASDFARPPGR
jgi:Holliday junction DNA helicase RuvB